MHLMIVLTISGTNYNTFYAVRSASVVTNSSFFFIIFQKTLLIYFVFLPSCA